MPKVLRLWAVYAYLDLLFLTRDPQRFLTYVISDGVAAGASVVAVLLLSARFGGIGPWSAEHVLFMLGYGLLVNGLLDVLFGYNVKMVSRRIGRGQLDHTLLQPHSTLTTFVTEGFVPFSSAGPALVGIGLFSWALSRVQIDVTLAWVGLLVIQMLASATIVLSFQFTWATLAFWAPRGAEEISSSTNHMLTQLYAFPLDRVGAGTLTGMLTVLPIGFVAWYPSRALLGLDGSPLSFALTPIAAVGFGLLASWAFRKGLRQYARVGSQRYSDFGHRR